MQKQILLINDMCGYGKVALSAMLPVLSHMGFRLHNLPTALVSNTLNYPEFFIHETTDYMKQSLAIWERLGFSFDAISTGFIVTEEQVIILGEYCEKQSAQGVKIFVDPIMGDNGSLYAGVPESTVGHMRRLVALADYAVPNYTEACLLADAEVKETVSKEEAFALVDKLRKIGAKSVVVTSLCLDDGHAVVGYDHVSGQQFLLEFDELDAYFPGTGDIFSSIVMGRVMKGASLEEATWAAMNAVSELIRVNIDQEDKPQGLPIEAFLEVLDK